MCTMEDVPTAAPAVHNVKDTMEDAPINTDMSRSPFCPPLSPIDVVPIVAVEFFMAAPNSQCEDSSHLSLPFIYFLCCESSLTYQVARIPLVALRIDVCEQQQEYFEEGKYSMNTT
ncbi:hypothetical protein U9M48_031708 [Paspalum notatum var. saurae]|uniref:Uncharacterized protein n=1 Tax=Paspalum notatum var. saurae TaxID=547442 RepID=A0AAQ3U5U0_PASNO